MNSRNQSPRSKLIVLACAIAFASIALWNCKDAGPQETAIEPSTEYTVFDIAPENDEQRVWQVAELVRQARNLLDDCEKKFDSLQSNNAFRSLLAAGESDKTSEALAVLQIEEVAYACETSAKTLRTNFQKIARDLPPGTRKTMSNAIYHSEEALQGRSALVRTIVQFFDDTKPENARKTLEARDQATTNRQKALNLLENLTQQACDELSVHPCEQTDSAKGKGSENDEASKR